jgi:hypothetical protein
VLFGRRSRLPLCAKSLPGGIADIPALKAAIKTLGLSCRKKTAFVLRPDFYSESNLDWLLNIGCRFILSAPADQKWIGEIIGEHCAAGKPNRQKDGAKRGSLAPVATRLCVRAGRRLYLHIYFDSARVAHDNDEFARKLLGWKAELKSGVADARNAEYYGRFFSVRKMPKGGHKIYFNNAAIKKYRDHCAGFFCLVTKNKMSAPEALAAYQTNEIIKKCFREPGCALGAEQIGTPDAVFFAQSLAAVILAGIKKTLLSDGKLKHMSEREAIEAMEQVIGLNFSGKYGAVIAEIEPLQKEIMAAFDIKCPQ